MSPGISQTQDAAMEDVWTDELAAYLTDLSSVQSELLSTLGEKRAALLSADTAQLEAVNGKEAQLAARLADCQERRLEMLQRAEAEGSPHDSIRTLASSRPAAGRLRIVREVDAAERQARILQQECLVNWVVVQRTLLHLSQMLEIIATGGRQRPTYGKDDCVQGHGVLVDHAV
jgi:flagellar biosynthesis/type III secretory pathway chaperone